MGGLSYLKSQQTIPPTPPQALISFVEKPDAEKAECLLKGGKHLWNAGIFLFSTTTILTAFDQHAPDILAKVQSAYDNAIKDLGFIRLASDPWVSLDEISIDYAIMERVSNLSVVPYNGRWSDLGDWNAVSREEVEDIDGNVKLGQSNTIDCKNSFLTTTSESQQIVAIGLDNIIAVAMPDAVLIAHKERAQDVKEAVSLLKSKSVSQAENSPRNYRPWGWYESLIISPRFQVKRIVVNPGGVLSLQSP